MLLSGILQGLFNDLCKKYTKEKDTQPIYNLLALVSLEGHASWGTAKAGRSDVTGGSDKAGEGGGSSSIGGDLLLLQSD